MKRSRFLSWLFVLLIPLSSVADDTWVNSFKRCNRYKLKSCFSDPATAALPFIMSHGKKTKTVALLIHGFTDSPYYMKDVATALFSKGMNIVAIKLSGHAGKPEDLHTVTAFDWLKDLDVAFEEGNIDRFGENVILGGFSLGGSLAIYGAAQYPDRVSKLLLFAPGIKGSLQIKALVLCWLPNHFVGDKREDNPVVYPKVSSNGICEASKLVREMSQDSVPDKVRAPVFTVLSEYDSVISSQDVIDFVSEFQSPKKHFLLFTKVASKLYFPDRAKQGGAEWVRQSTPQIKHGYLMTDHHHYIPRVKNPAFQKMREELLEFVTQ